MRPLAPVVVFVHVIALLLPTAAAPADEAKVK